MKRSFRHTGALFAAVLLIACGPPMPPQYGGGGGASVVGGAKPGWVDGHGSAEYPEMQWMLGVGHGQDRMPCENDARAAIAKIFEANISQVSRDWQGHFSRVNSAGRGVRIEAMSVQQLTQVSTNYTLKGVNVVKLWQGEGAFHCLAVLDRVATAQTLREAIAKLDTEIQVYVQEGDKGGNVTQKFVAYQKAMDRFQRRQALNADLRVVARQGVDPPLGWQALVAKFTGTQSKIKIGFNLKGRERAKVQSCLGERLIQEGIQVQEGSSDVDLWIHGKIDMKRAGFNLGTEMVRATINMRVTSADDARTLAAFSRDVKVGRPRLPQSVQLAASKLCIDVAPTLAKEIRAALGR